MIRQVILGCFLLGVSAAMMREVYQNQPLPLDPETSSDTPGEPLFLTKFIEDGQPQLAKNLSRVGPLDGVDILSYAGYFTVNRTTESNLFFWFFPALNQDKNAPILLWLQGGPGGSSLFGLFVEHGPLLVTSDQVAQLRNSTWANQFHMLYIDNPVGTGFSFTTKEDGYVTNQSEVGRDLFEALQQFFTVFSEYANNDFYVTGESYAGKYVPAVAYTIHKNKAQAKMKLKGIAIGDGWCDPINMLDYADFLLQLGMIDDLQAAKFRQEQNAVKDLIYRNHFQEASYAVDGLMAKFKDMSGSHFYYNFLLSKEPDSFAYYNKFVQTTKTRKAIHVGSLPYNDGSKVEYKLRGDIMRSVKPWIVELMEHYKVMIYNGQLDVIVAYPLTVSFVNSILWSGAKEFATTKRVIWRSPHSDEPAGYVRQVRNFTEVLVRNAGHILPYDQPYHALDMIDRFVNDKPFN